MVLPVFYLRMSTIPDRFRQWFRQQGWRILAHQHAMVERFEQGESTLLIAPTGTGKTLSGFLPSLIAIDRDRPNGLHTLYISPLKALTYDIERNLMAPIRDMGLAVTVESRTGDTSAHRRRRQRTKPPNILLTTPESLMLMLSYPDAPKMFAELKAVVVDEIHHLAPGKRGDLTTLAMAQLEVLAPGFQRIGLSATVAEPETFRAWLGPNGKPAGLLEVQRGKPPQVNILPTKDTIPYNGFMAKYAISDIMRAIEEAKTTIVFVNTRAQTELLFQLLWDSNEQGLPIGIYHSSLTKEKRVRTLELMAAGKLRAIVATSALELGIDWGDVDVVIQVGAPKGVSRLLQRIGRSNHKVDEPSKAWLVPSNRFELLECRAAIDAIAANTLDGESPADGSDDVVIQFIMNAACSGPATPTQLFTTVTRSWSYRHLRKETFDKLFTFVAHGGYALRSYERYHRLVENSEGEYLPASAGVVQRHRQNIGVIVESGKLKVKRLHGRGGRMLGEVEESFGQLLRPGDTFYFAGEVLAFETIRDMILEARPSKANDPLIPTYAGGQMPLSTFLADGVRDLLDHPERWSKLSKPMRAWLELQEKFSILPGRDHFLIETFPRHKLFYTVFYTFEGRRANQTLGMLLSRRMERAGLQPITFTVTDYGLAIATVKPVSEAHIHALLAPDILFEELDEWLADSPMLKRSFRRVAVIAGLVEQNFPGQRKTVKQVTFNTDLIYDVLRKYEPDHVLLRLTRADAERELLDTDRLGALLHHSQNRIVFKALPRPSPLSLPVILDVRSERLPGKGMEALLNQLHQQQEAEHLIDEVRHELG